jgi:ubiquitin-conjugating enzyme E2 O
LDRVFQLGDYCKRSFEDLQSGVIIDVKVKARFEHAISHEVVPGWFTTDDLKEKIDGEIGDLVACDDWIGQVSFQELVNEMMLIKGR